MNNKKTEKPSFLIQLPGARVGELVNVYDLLPAEENRDPRALRGSIGLRVHTPTGAEVRGQRPPALAQHQGPLGRRKGPGLTRG